MPKKKELLIILILAVLVLAGTILFLGGFYFGTKRWVRQVPREMKRVTGVINGEKYKDFRACAAKDSINKDYCYRLSAIANNDPSICTYLEDKSTTQYLKNNCMLIAEAVNLSILPIICKGLDETACIKQEGCIPISIAPAVMGGKSVYDHCDIDAQYFCQQSGGLLNSRYECVCPEGRIIIKPYGCFDCEDFSTLEAKRECLEMVSLDDKGEELKREEDEKKALLDRIELQCGKRCDGYTRMLVDQRFIDDFVGVFIHSEHKPTLDQIRALEGLGVVVRLEETWIPPFESQQTGFFIVSVPIKKIPDVCSLEFIEKLTSAEEEHSPQVEK